MSFSLATGATAVFDLVFKDAAGNLVAPVAGGSVTIDATATASLSEDGASVTVTGVSEGVATLTYTNGALTASYGPFPVTGPAASVTIEPAA
jgi:hypothetical protein